jgi:membrane protein required for colicin V production
MTGLDIAIIGVLFTSALIGIVRGFTKEVFSLFTWGGAATISWWMLPMARGFVHSYIANPMIADGAAIFVLFILSLIILSIISNILAGHIRDSSFGGVDRSLGFGFGILRGVILISAAELIFSTFTPRQAQSPMIKSSKFIHLVRNGGDSLLRILPTSLYDMILSQAAKAENQIKSQASEQIVRKAQNALPQIPRGTQGEQIPPSSEMLPPPQMGSPQDPSQTLTSQNLQQGGPSSLLTPQASTGPKEMLPQNLPPRGLGESTMLQDKQSTADNLGRLQPLAPQRKAQDLGYRSEHRGDMQRLIEENLTKHSEERQQHSEEEPSDYERGVG